MADYLWAKIVIGGPLSRGTVTDLIERFGVSPNEATASGYLEREDAHAPGGCFEDLEAYLVEQAIPFDRTSDGKYEISPEVRRFRPSITDARGHVSLEVDRVLLCDHDNQPVIAVRDVQQAIAETQTRGELEKHLAHLCGSDIPVLSSLQIIEGSALAESGP